MSIIAPTLVASPPRKSRRRWYILGGIVLMIAAPIGYYFFAGWWSDRELAELEREIDESDPNWRLNDLMAEVKAPPDDKNAALQIKKIQEMLAKNDPFASTTKWADLPWDHPNARLSKEFDDALRDVFAKLPQETLVEMRKLKDMPDGHFAVEMDDNPFATKLDFLQDTRSLIYRLQGDAVMRSQLEDHDGAAESCMAMVNIPGALRGQSTLVGQLVRIAEQAIAVENVERALGQGKVSAPTLAKLQTLLEAEADADGLHLAMRGERASAHQTFKNLREGKTTFTELYALTNIKPPLGERLLDAFPGIILKDYPGFLRMMNDQVDASRLKDAERAAAFDRIEQRMKENRTNLLIRMIMPAVAKVANASQRTQAMMRCAVVGVAAERYRLEHDAWPRSQEDLVKAKLLKAARTDPYDGQPLRLKRTPTGMIVYSIGPDLTDNGGTLNRKNRIAPGSDLGFELWDPSLRGIPPPPDD